MSSAEAALASGAALEFTDLRKTFRVQRQERVALAGVSAGVRAGVVTGLVGPDGAGKTTLMRLVVGLLTPDGGRVRVFGKDVASEALAVQEDVSYMPQTFGLYGELTVAENLSLYADLQGVAPRFRPERFRELMELTGLAPFMDRQARRLSGGMKQKLGLACALVRSPRLLVLDEPTVGVDPLSRRELWAIIRRQVDEEGLTVLLSTSYLDEAERCSDVLLLHRGRLLDRGPPERFTAAMRGRVFEVRTRSGDRRDLQERLLRSPGVLDVVILGDSLRVLLRKDHAGRTLEVLTRDESFEVTAAEPRFEDAFVDLLGGGEPAEIAAAPRRGAPAGNNLPPGPAIAVGNLERRFGAFRAVKGISFEVSPGEIFGLLGANGAGKSTTFRMLCALLPPTSGEVRVAGVDLRRAPAAARSRIGYMSQHFSLYGPLTVRQNLRFFGAAYGLDRARVKEAVAWACETFGLNEQMDVDSERLPLGYKQRLSMACALLHRPNILFLDEPTSGVDPLERREFWRRISALAKTGVTIIVTTHFMDEAESCDRMAVMASGSILAIGTPEEIKELARGPERPNPTLEDAFIHLIEHHEELRA